MSLLTLGENTLEKSVLVVKQEKLYHLGFFMQMNLLVKFHQTWKDFSFTRALLKLDGQENCMQIIKAFEFSSNLSFFYSLIAHSFLLLHNADEES